MIDDFSSLNSVLQFSVRTCKHLLSGPEREQQWPTMEACVDSCSLRADGRLLTRAPVISAAAAAALWLQRCSSSCSCSSEVCARFCLLAVCKRATHADGSRKSSRENPPPILGLLVAWSPMEDGPGRRDPVPRRTQQNPCSPHSADLPSPPPSPPPCSPVYVLLSS